MTRPAAALFAAAATVAACVPGLPGSQLTGDYDAGQAGGAGAAGGGAGGRGGAPPASGGSAATGPGTAGQSGPGSGGAGGAAGIGGPGSGGRATGGTGGPPTSEFAFVTDAGTPPNLAVNASYLFWANTNRRTLTKIRVDGTGGPTSIAPLMTPNTWVAADAQNVYWNGGIPGSPIGILKLDNDGTAPTFLGPEPAELSALAVNASGVYWSTTAGTVTKVGLQGGAPIILAQTGSVADLIVDEENVYWVGDCVPAAAGCQSINKVAVSGGTPVEVARSQAIAGLAVDPTFIYWADSSNGALTRSALDGTTEALALPYRVDVTSLAVDPAGLYWTDAKGMVFGALPGAPMQRLVGNSGGSPARGVTLDARNVYWLATTPPTAAGPFLGTIMKAPK